jgi:hypothetical protein
VDRSTPFLYPKPASPQLQLGISPFVHISLSTRAPDSEREKRDAETRGGGGRGGRRARPRRGRPGVRRGVFQAQGKLDTDTPAVDYHLRSSIDPPSDGEGLTVACAGVCDLILSWPRRLSWGPTRSAASTGARRRSAAASPPRCSRWPGWRSSPRPAAASAASAPPPSSRPRAAPSGRCARRSRGTFSSYVHAALLISFDYSR